MKNHIKTIVVLLTIILLVTRVCGMTIVWAQEEKQEDRILKTLEEQAEDIESVNEGQVTKSIPDCDVWMADTMIFGFNNDQKLAATITPAPNPSIQFKTFLYSCTLSL